MQENHQEKNNTGFFQKATKISNKQPNPPPTRIRERKTNKTQGNSKDHNVAVVSDSLQPHRLYSPWNSPGQNTGVGSLSRLRGIIPTPGSNPGLLHCRQFLCHLSHQGNLELNKGSIKFHIPDPNNYHWTSRIPLNS